MKSLLYEHFDLTSCRVDLVDITELGNIDSTGYPGPLWVEVVIATDYHACSVHSSWLYLHRSLLNTDHKLTVPLDR